MPAASTSSARTTSRSSCSPSRLLSWRRRLGGPLLLLFWTHCSVCLLKPPLPWPCQHLSLPISPPSLLCAGFMVPPPSQSHPPPFHPLGSLFCIPFPASLESPSSLSIPCPRVLLSLFSPPSGVPPSPSIPFLASPGFPVPLSLWGWPCSPASHLLGCPQSPFICIPFPSILSPGLPLFPSIPFTAVPSLLPPFFPWDSSGVPPLSIQPPHLPVSSVLQEG